VLEVNSNQKTTMPTLHLLLSAINEYPPEVSNLNGCENDARAYLAYFRQMAEQKKWTFRSQLLINDKASRAKLIHAFETTPVAEGDTFIWCHSGHGTRVPAPAVFHHNSADKMHRALVLHGGTHAELFLDKEISWLIWSVTHNKNITFLAFTDTCFSGSSFRDEATERTTILGAGAKPLEEYLGQKDYCEVGENALTPPRGNYLQFSASQFNYPALERRFPNGTQGVFTYAILEELRQIKEPRSFDEIYQKVRARLASMASDQIPQIDASGSHQTHHAFLAGGVVTPKFQHWVYFSPKHGQYVINAGSIFGIDAEKPPLIQVQLEDGLKSVTISSIYPTYSTLDYDPSLDKIEDLALAEIDLDYFDPLLIALGESLPPDEKEELRDALSPLGTRFAKLTNVPENAFYLLEKNSQQQIYLSGAPLAFCQLAPRGSDQITNLWADVQRIGRWRYLQTLSHPDTKLTENDVEFSIRRYVEPKAGIKLEAPNEETKNWKSGIDLWGELRGSQSVIPAFSCQVKNNASVPLHVRCLWLMSDFAVNTQLLDDGLVLQPGQSTWLRLVHEGKEYPVIFNSPDDYLEPYGIIQNPETLQFIVSTEPLSISSFEQDGVRLIRVRGDINRSPDFDPRFSSAVSDYSDWRTYRIPITTTLLPEPTFLPQNLLGHQLALPEEFKASAQVLPQVTVFEILAKENIKPAENPFPDQPYAWSPGLNYAPPPCYLALSNLNNVSAVSFKNPLTITLPASPATKGEYRLQPCWFSPTSLRWEVADFSVEATMLHLHNCVEYQKGNAMLLITLREHLAP
jgi:hypothetical protein